jgi:hypothetical protein
MARPFKRRSTGAPRSRQARLSWVWLLAWFMLCLGLLPLALERPVLAPEQTQAQDAPALRQQPVSLQEVR